MNFQSIDQITSSYTIISQTNNSSRGHLESHILPECHAFDSPHSDGCLNRVEWYFEWRPFVQTHRPFMNGRSVRLHGLTTTSVNFLPSNGLNTCKKCIFLYQHLHVVRVEFGLASVYVKIRTC